MIDSPTVTTDHDVCVDSGPVVTLPSDVAPGPATTDRTRLLAALDGLDPAGSVPVGWLISLLRRLGNDPTVELTFDGTTACVPPKAMTLRAVARRCDRSPSTVGTWRQAWHRLGLVEAGPPPAVNVARLSEACVGMPPATQDVELSPAPLTLTAAPNGSASENLDVLLRHLRLAAAANEDTAVDVITGLAVRLLDSTARRAAHSSDIPRTVREIDSSLEALSLSSDKRDARSSARPAARPAVSSSERSTADTLALLAPLLKAVDRLGLAPLTDGEALSRALRPYSDEQVLHAQSVLLRQCETQRNLASPIGLLVRRAQQGSPEYFELPPPPPAPEPPPPDDHGPPMDPEQQAAAVARARGQLANASSARRRPVHGAVVETAR